TAAHRRLLQAEHSRGSLSSRARPCAGRRGCRVAAGNSCEHRIMWEDPIVVEVHRAREKLAAEYNFDVAAYFADLRERQAALGGRLMHPKTRAEPTAETDR